MATITVPASPAAASEAAGFLQEGALAILPTDTVYGICADARQDRATQAIYTAKGKDADAPLQLLFSPDRSLLTLYAVLTDAARALVDGLGSGPWTIVTSAAPGWESLALAGGRTVGFRIPGNGTVHTIVEALGAPLVASSANRHGEPSPATCGEAVAQVGEFCCIAIDDGPAVEGIDSTVIDCSADEVRILREGAIDRQTVARILGLSEIPVLRSVRQ